MELDEIRLDADTTVVELQDGAISTYTIRPRDLPVSNHSNGA